MERKELLWGNLPAS